MSGLAGLTPNTRQHYSEYQTSCIFCLCDSNSRLRSGATGPFIAVLFRDHNTAVRPREMFGDNKGRGSTQKAESQGASRFPSSHNYGNIDTSWAQRSTLSISFCVAEQGCCLYAEQHRPTTRTGHHKARYTSKGGHHTTRVAASTSARSSQALHGGQLPTPWGGE